MAQITVNDLTEIGSADPNDFLLIWDSSIGATRKIKVSNLLSSSTGSSISSGVPVVIRGQMGNQGNMYTGQNIHKNNRFYKQAEITKTISETNMFAVNSVVSGQIDSDLIITKAAGEETVYFNDVAITVGGAAKDVPVPERKYTKRGSKVGGYTVNITVGSEQLTLRTGAYMNYSIQVYA